MRIKSFGCIRAEFSVCHYTLFLQITWDVSAHSSAVTTDSTITTKHRLTDDFASLSTPRVELAQSLTFKAMLLQVPLPSMLGKLHRDSWWALVNKALPAVSSSYLGCVLICVRRGWHVLAADWADMQLTDIHNPQTVKLQVGSGSELKITCWSEEEQPLQHSLLN